MVMKRIPMLTVSTVLLQSLYSQHSNSTSTKFQPVVNLVKTKVTWRAFEVFLTLNTL